ncbi:MAG: PQQ-dependent sugar dehydrogenase [Alphaproteobacteria bacterium]
MKKIFLLLFGLYNLPYYAHAQEDISTRTFPSEIGALKVDVVASGLEHPWSLAFLPDGRMLVTERPGRLRIVSQKGALSEPVLGVPPVYADGQGGLLDVVIDPQFADNRLVYFSYAEATDGNAGTAVARASLQNNKLHNLKVIFRQQPKVVGPNHWGSRLVLGPDEKLFITLGERYKYSEKAQDLTTHLGKIVRIETDGSVPMGNPFAEQTDALSDIWSYGHRNIQGAALHPATKQLWIHEHGPRGGDEINIIQPGGNYGWPQASYGSHYSLLPIMDDHKGRGYIEPIHYWTPSIAPSGMLFYTGSRIPEWKGSLFVGALAGEMLVRLELDGGTIVKEERLLEGLYERIRDVRQGPDGHIYLLTDSEDGKVLRLITVE